MDHINGTMASKLFTYIASGIPVIISKELEYMSRFVVENGIGIVLSQDEMSALSTVLMAPMTTRGFDFPCRVSCRFKGKRGLILLDQMRAVDKSRLVKNLGTIGGNTQGKLCSTLQEMFVY